MTRQFNIVNNSVESFKPKDINSVVLRYLTSLGVVKSRQKTWIALRKHATKHNWEKTVLQDRLRVLYGLVSGTIQDIPHYVLPATPLEYLQSMGVAILDDENVHVAFERHAKEQQWSDKIKKRFQRELNESIRRTMNSKLQELKGCNEILHNLGFPKCQKMRQCWKQFDKIFINIYDYVSGKYELHSSWNHLRDYSIKNKFLYPRKMAKEEGFRCLLKPFF